MSFLVDIYKILSDAIYINLIKEDRYLLFIKGLGVSLKLTIYAAILGIIIGLLVALARMTKNKVLNKIALLYIDLIRGTPAVVQLVIIYYAILGSSSLSKIGVASVAFGINSGAYVAELVRAGIQAVDKGQMEGCPFPWFFIWTIYGVYNNPPGSEEYTTCIGQ